MPPWILDPQGIARLSRWENEEDRGKPNWKKVLDFIVTLGCDPTEGQHALQLLHSKVCQLPQIMQKHHVDAELIQQLSLRIDSVKRELENL